MEADVNFNFPFPTLKQLSLVSIGLHFVNLSGRRAGFSERPKPYEITNDCSLSMSFQFYWIVENLPAPRVLKREIFTFSLGMYDQFDHWIKSCPEGAQFQDWVDYKYLDPIFDVHGIVDESRIWQRYFERMCRKKGTRKDLLKLLHVAITRALVPQIGMVLRKMLISVGAGATQLVGPREDYVDEWIVLFYSFAPTRLRTNIRRSAYESFSWYKRELFYSLSAFEVTEQGFEIRVDPMKNMDTLKKYINLHYDTYNFWHTVRQHVNYQCTEFLGLILKVLNQDQRHDFLSDGVDVVLFLESFKRWPFTRFFVPLVKLMRQTLFPVFYLSLFNNMVQTIPYKQEIDAFSYGELLLELWDNTPPDVQQQQLQNSFRPMHSVNVFELNMEELFEKNLTIYSLIRERAQAL